MIVKSDDLEEALLESKKSGGALVIKGREPTTDLADMDVMPGWLYKALFPGEDGELN